MDSSARKILVLDSDNIGHDLDWDVLASLGQLVVRNHTSDSELPAILKREQPAILVSNRPQIGADALAASALRLVCLTATGTNTVDLEAAQSRGIAVCNIAGYSTNSVAQHTFALALELIHRTSELNARSHTWHQKHNEAQPWTDLSRPFGELNGKTWGILGLGSIGRRVAELATAFGCSVQWASASESPRNEAWPQCSIDQLFATSHVVSIHSPLNAQTQNLVNLARLRSMRRDAILVNVGRGGIVNEADLAVALNQHLIAGAALDVLMPEPPTTDNPLFALDAHTSPLLITPHVAWAAKESRQRALDETAANIEAWVRGDRRNRI